MRFEIAALALLSSAGLVHAGSIDTIRTGTDAIRSIETISCAHCEQKVQAEEEQAAVELEPGTQKIEIRDVNGVKKIYRTEAWLGGSPATYVTTALPDAHPATAEVQTESTDDLVSTPVTTVQPPVSADVDMIDEKATTSAVTADTGAEARVEPTKSFDPAQLELRVN